MLFKQAVRHQPMSLLATKTDVRTGVLLVTILSAEVTPWQLCSWVRAAEQGLGIYTQQPDQHVFLRLLWCALIE
jgi:hypothetical protein